MRHKLCETYTNRITSGRFHSQRRQNLYFRNEKALSDVDSKLKKEQATYQDLYMKSQQVQKALQTGQA